jgi:hypothetical protein
MRRSTAKLAKIAGALGSVLALPLSFAATPSLDKHSVERAAASTSFAQFASAESVIDAWRNYALADLSTGFSWASAQSIAATAPSLFDRGNARLTEPASRFNGSQVTPQSIQITYARTRVSDTPLYVPSEVPQLMQDYMPGLQRYILSPSMTQRVGENSAVSVAAIFAYERFAGFGLGPDTNTSALPQDDLATQMSQPYGWRNPYGSYGVGLRVDFNNAITDRLSWQVGYQSRVNMDAFNAYRGVYSEPGTFDIPASANLGLGYALTQDFKLDLGMQRVMYSGITPFTSNALPTRFLILLGSEVSPAFAWADLNVYSAGFTWHDPTDTVWSLHYSTREQPLPTSRLLQTALQPFLSSRDVEFGLAHAFGDFSNVRFSMMYAPTEFVLGLPNTFSLRDNNGGNQVEYELLWTTRF